MSGNLNANARDLSLPMTVRLQRWKGRGGQAATLFVCVNRRQEDLAVSCAPRGGTEIAAAIESGIQARRLKVKFRQAYCLSACMEGPNIKLMPSNTRFYGVRLSDVPEVLDILEAQLKDREAAAKRSQADRELAIATRAGTEAIRSSS